MAISAEIMDGLKQDIATARKRALNFGLCLGKKPETTVMMTHRTKGPEMLGKLAKREGETSRLAFGTMTVKAKDLLLACENDPPSGTARKTKLFLQEAGLKMKVVILDPSGNVLEQEGDADDTETDGVNVAPDSTETLADTAPSDPAEAVWLKLKASVQPALLKVLKAGLGDPGKLRAAWGLAAERAANGDFTGATKIAQSLVAMIKAAASTGGDVAENAAASDEIADNLVPFVKARLEWIEARRSVQGELEKVKAAILAAVQDDAAYQNPVMGRVDELFTPLQQLDGRLQDKLEELVETPEGPARAQKKKEAVAIVKAYSGVLETPFFKEIDANPFAKVAVRSTAQASLGNVVRALRG